MLVKVIEFPAPSRGCTTNVFTFKVGDLNARAAKVLIPWPSPQVEPPIEYIPSYEEADFGRQFIIFLSKTGILDDLKEESCWIGGGDYQCDIEFVVHSPNKKRFVVTLELCYVKRMPPMFDGAITPSYLVVSHNELLGFLRDKIILNKENIKIERRIKAILMLVLINCSINGLELDIM